MITRNTMITKKYLIFATFIISLCFPLKAENWYQNLKWPSDRVQDEVQLLPFGFEVKLNFFLQKLKKQTGIAVNFHLIQSLEGVDIDARARDLMTELPDGEETLIFILALSDRQLKILPHPSIEGKVSEQSIDHLIRVTLPAFKKQAYALGIQIFLQNLIYELDPQSSLTTPNLVEKKGKTLNNLLFFLACTFLILILGHKLKISPAITYKDQRLTKPKTSSLGLFWK